MIETGSRRMMYERARDGYVRRRLAFADDATISRKSTPPSDSRILNDCARKSCSSAYDMLTDQAANSGDYEDPSSIPLSRFSVQNASALPSTISVTKSSLRNTPDTRPRKELLTDLSKSLDLTPDIRSRKELFPASSKILDRPRMERKDPAAMNLEDGIPAKGRKPNVVRVTPDQAALFEKKFSALSVEDKDTAINVKYCSKLDLESWKDDGPQRSSLEALLAKSRPSETVQETKALRMAFASIPTSAHAVIRLKAADMAKPLQEHALRCAQESLADCKAKATHKQVACTLKKEFDEVYGPAWHCIVGSDFGSYVTHSLGGFLYFSIGKTSILLFRTAVELIN